MKKNLTLSVVLIFIEQCIKVFINAFLMEKWLCIEKIIGFRPYLNKTQLSIFNNELNLNLEMSILILFSILSLLILFVVCLFLKKSANPNSIKYLDKMMICLFSGGFCSIIDKIFWGGSLDYILLAGKIIDLKDIYLFIGIYFFLIWIIKEKSIEKNEEKRKL